MKEKLNDLIMKVGKKVGIDVHYFLLNGFWVGLRQTGTALLSLLLAAFFTRSTTTEVYGQYQLIISILGMASIFSLPGLNTALVSAVAEGNDGDYKPIVKKSFIYSFIAVPVLLIAGAYYWHKQSSIGLPLMIVAIFFPFYYAPNTWDWFFQAKKRFDISAKYGLFLVFFNTAATSAVIFYSKTNLNLIILMYMISYSVFNGVFYILSLRSISNQKSDKKTIPYGMFLTYMSILEVIYANLDKFLVGILISPAALAIYAIGITFTKQLQSVTKNFLWLTVPKMIEQKGLPRKTFAKIFAFSSAVTVVAFFAFKYLIPIFFSDKYSGSVLLSNITILFFPFFILSNVYKDSYIYNKQKKVLKLEYWISPATKIILSVVAIKLWGIIGMAIVFGLQPIISLVNLFLINQFFLSKKRERQ